VKRLIQTLLISITALFVTVNLSKAGDLSKITEVPTNPSLGTEYNVLLGKTLFKTLLKIRKKVFTLRYIYCGLDNNGTLWMDQIIEESKTDKTDNSLCLPTTKNDAGNYETTVTLEGATVKIEITPKDFTAKVKVIKTSQ